MVDSVSVRLAVIGAGPAGLAAAAAAAGNGVETVLLDEQPVAGGQIYRGLPGREPTPARQRIFGADYYHGQILLDALPKTRLTHISNATVWQVTPEREVYYSQHGASRRLRAERLIIATGAYERPMPFPGWTLPGVMTIGAGQILLKTAGLLPQGEIVLAGSGPLLLLVAVQYLRAGAAIKALVETTPRENRGRALRYLPRALTASAYLRKGLKLLREIRTAKIPHYRYASGLRAVGDDQVTALRFDSGGKTYELPCSTVLIHTGVVPNVQITRSLELEHRWDSLARCWRPRLGADGATELDGISVAGDGGGIQGAISAELGGRIAGLQAAVALGALDPDAAADEIAIARRRRTRDLAVRPFLDALYAPAPEFLAPPDDATIICRCEEVSAGQIRDYVKLGCLGPNQTKSFGRPGMGPCQGRLCGLTVSETIAAARGVPVSEIGYYRIRPPIKPATLGELASLADDV